MDIQNSSDSDSDSELGLDRESESNLETESEIELKKKKEKKWKEKRKNLVNHHYHDYDQHEGRRVIANWVRYLICEEEKRRHIFVWKQCPYFHCIIRLLVVSYLKKLNNISSPYEIIKELYMKRKSFSMERKSYKYFMKSLSL